MAIGTVGPAAATVDSGAAKDQAAASAIMFGAPSGCPWGAVCFYRQGNGGDLCGYYRGDERNLGVYGCANIGPSGSTYNHGFWCGGCQDVNLYFNSNYGGAWYCLPKDHYLLYIEKDHFNRGQGLYGYGQTLAYRPIPPNGPGPGGVVSERWTAC
jgi:hypothetical protein